MFLVLEIALHKNKNSAFLSFLYFYFQRFKTERHQFIYDNVYTALKRCIKKLKC